MPTLYQAESEIGIPKYLFLLTRAINLMHKSGTLLKTNNGNVFCHFFKGKFRNTVKFENSCL